MAGTIQISANVQVNNGIDKNPFTPSTYSAVQTGADVYAQTITVTDAGYTALAKGAVGSCGYAAVYNLSSTAADIVYVSFDGGTTDHLELGPGAFALAPLRSSITIGNVQVKAATGKTVAVKYMIWEA